MSVLLALMLAWAAPGDIYRCRDAAGAERFQDRPCAGLSSERLAGGGEDSAASRLALQRWLRQRAPVSRQAPRQAIPSRNFAGGPVSEAQLASCSERFLKCAHGTASIMDRCVANLPRCNRGASAQCCPQACISRYQELRRGGHPLASAVRLALLDPDAFACAGAVAR